MPHIGDQIIDVLHHISVGTDDSGLLRDSFHSRRVERTVEAGRRWGRSLIGMVRQQQSERHLDRKSVVEGKSVN